MQRMQIKQDVCHHGQTKEVPMLWQHSEPMIVSNVCSEEFEVGDIAYWLQGSGFCILYGRTPASTSDKPRLISPGNYFAKIEGDISIFKSLNGLDLTIERGKE